MAAIGAPPTYAPLLSREQMGTGGPLDEAINALMRARRDISMELDRLLLQREQLRRAREDEHTSQRRCWRCGGAAASPCWRCQPYDLSDLNLGNAAV
jgi:hypothetical protein